MKKNVLTFAGIALMLITAFTFTACNDDVNDVKIDKSKLLGYWDLQTIDLNGETITVEPTSEEFVRVFFGSENEFKSWEVDEGGQLVLISTGNYAVKGNKITVHETWTSEFDLDTYTITVKKLDANQLVVVGKKDNMTIQMTFASVYLDPK